MFDKGIESSGKRRQNTKTEAAVAWMERYFDLIQDNVPNIIQGIYYL